MLSHACTNRVLIEGRQATGVEFETGGAICHARATREVIVSAGSIMSPVILKRSGIGPADELQSCGIKTLIDLPEVGENLMDHLELYIQQACRQPITLYSWMNPLGKALIGARWILSKTGLGATNHFETGAHIRSHEGIVYPNIQFHFLPLAISYDGKSLAKGHGYQVHVGTKRSKSRGWVRLRDGNPTSMPRVCFNYMSHADDWLEMRACVRLSRELFAQPAFDPYRGEELAPGPGCITDEQIDAFIRARVETACHPCGTCRMGSDPRAVVDTNCAVNGVASLRVVDSSIMPQATAGDLNAPTIMLAERAADLIRGKSLSPASHSPILVDRNWKHRQRSDAISLDLSNDSDAIASALDYHH